jgi:hypothetical protein
MMEPRLQTLWMTVVTALWVLPVTGFALLNARRPPAPLAFTAFAAVGAAGALVLVRAPRTLLRLRRFEDDGRVWERIGVRAFAALAPHGRFLRRPHLRDAARAAEANERLHVAMLLAGAAVAIWAMSIDRPAIVIYLALAAVPLNLYPIALQRHLRGRLGRAIRRADARSEAQRATNP